MFPLIEMQQPGRGMWGNGMIIPLAGGEAKGFDLSAAWRGAYASNDPSTLNPGPVRIEIYDVLGRLAIRAIEQWMPSGAHEFPLTAARADGTPLSRGVYFYRLRSGDGESTGKLVIAR